MTLMGGPIDTRRSPTEVNKLAERRGVDWFRRNACIRCRSPIRGSAGEVYPGFLQLSGFMAMNLDRHVNAHLDMFNHLVAGDGDSAEKHRDFYDEYLAVMDMDAAFYMQTIETVFVRHALPKGEMKHRGQLVDPSAIRRCGLMTIEGENDDISGVGQSSAAHELCVNIPAAKKLHHLQREVGHYGVFNGSRFRQGDRAENAQVPRLDRREAHEVDRGESRARGTRDGRGLAVGGKAAFFARDRPFFASSSPTGEFVKARISRAACRRGTLGASPRFRRRHSLHLPIK